jgi:hypothetical protein
MKNCRSGVMESRRRCCADRMDLAVLCDKRVAPPVANSTSHLSDKNILQNFKISRLSQMAVEACRCCARPVLRLSVTG